MKLLKTLFQSPALLPRVRSDFPEFTLRASTDWVTVTVLRRWAYRHVRRALSRSCLLDGEGSFDFYNQTVSDLFLAFEQERGGLWCGGTAHALMLLYRHFGFTSYCVDMGVINSPELPNFTHVVTLVEIKILGKPLLSVQDGYFNIAYVDSASGEPLDYYDLLERLSRRQTESIRGLEPVNEASVSALLEPYAPIAPEISWAVPQVREAGQLTPSGLLKQSIRFTFDLFASQHVNRVAFEAFMATQGYPPNMIYLLLFPFAIYGNPQEADQILRKAQSIIAG